MLKFLNLKPHAFGLDISDLSLKIINLQKKRGGFGLASIGETRIQEGVVRKGEIKNKNALVKSIKQALNEVKGKKIDTKYVIASLPEEKSFLQVIQMPKILKEDLKSAIIFEAENHIPLPIEEVYLDFQIIEPSVNYLGASSPLSVKDEPAECLGTSNSLSVKAEPAECLDHYDILISALPQKTVDPYVECLKAAGLKPLAFEIESSSVARALVKNETAISPLLLIDLGAVRTNFIIFVGRSLRFNFSIPVSSLKFTEGIVRSMKIGPKEAEKLKMNYGLEGQSTEQGKEVFNALVPLFVDLTEQIKKYLDYYQSHSANGHLPANGQTVEKVLLCGGGANLKGLPFLLSEELKLPVEIANPWINLLHRNKKEENKIPLEESLKYVTAIGLALRNMQKNGY